MFCTHHHSRALIQPKKLKSWPEAAEEAAALRATGCLQGEQRHGWHDANVVKAAGEYWSRRWGPRLRNLHIGHHAIGLFRNEVAVNVNNVARTGLKQLTAVP